MSDASESTNQPDAQQELPESHPDWRPWHGDHGHESPLEAMWQWMVSKGVGGLSSNPAPIPEPVETVIVENTGERASGEITFVPEVPPDPASAPSDPPHALSEDPTG